MAIEPSIGGAFSHAWTILKEDFWRLLLIGFIAWLLGGAVASLLGRNNSFVTTLYQVLVGTPVTFGAAYVWLRAVRGINPEIADLFVPFQRYYVNTVLAGLLLTVVIAVGFILLIIPGIILSVRLCFVPFLVVDEGLGPVQALQESWNRTSGFSWTLFFAGIVALLILFVGFLIFIIGSIPALMLDYLAFASLYAAITSRKAGAAAAFV
jgi:hypothetical protein